MTGTQIDMQASEAIDRAEQELRALRNGDHPWAMHSPANFDDSDVILSLLVVVARAALADRERLASETAELRAKIADYLDALHDVGVPAAAYPRTGRAESGRVASTLQALRESATSSPLAQ